MGRAPRRARSFGVTPFTLPSQSQKRARRMCHKAHSHLGRHKRTVIILAKYSYGRQIQRDAHFGTNADHVVFTFQSSPQGNARASPSPCSLRRVTCTALVPITPSHLRTTMPPPNEVYTAFSFIGFVMCAIPFGWHLEGM